MGLKVGIIGCGSITKFRHGPEYQANPYVSELVFFDRNPERAKALAEQFGGSVVQSAEEILQDASVDLVSDCSSNESHEIFSTEALLAGKHVLCEKPIALTLEGAGKIVEAQKKSQKKLMIDHNQRFTPAHQKAKEIILSESLGKVLTFKTTFGHSGPEFWGVNKSNNTWFFKKDRSGLGVAGDLGTHKIDILHYLLDDEIQEVSAFQGALDKVDEHGESIEVCDNLVCSLKTKKGRIGTASFSWTYYGEEDNSTFIYCEKGVLKIYHDPEFQLEVITQTGEEVKYKLETVMTNANQTNTGVIDAFVDCVRLDQPPQVTGEDALLSLKVVLALLESANTKKVITV
ncbi:dehydrogenase [Salipaludibacillus neizhouensis]|uniref:Dehydrogenase n=1 Tax=Salipaludibacillus neizhouensis TaxID=885475 RepID=A0A3A9K0H9_9BACI|nr:Gfo/Idh/MocA family oxidoreductase [Salipaludibacillus neizhouensis]RKL66604.1 dehydrogenase [Salipaludibacillus neizhouensis]